MTWTVAMFTFLVGTCTGWIVQPHTVRAKIFIPRDVDLIGYALRYKAHEAGYIMSIYERDKLLLWTYVSE